MALDQFGIELLIKAQDEATNAIDNIAGHLGALGPLISKLASGAVGPLGIMAGAIAAVGGATVLAGAQVADQVEQLDRLSEQTGVTVHDLQVLRQVTEDAGGSADSLTVPLQQLSEAIARQDPLLQALNITGEDTFDVFRQVAAVITNTTDAGVRNQIMMRLLGRGGRQLVADMTAVTEAFDETEKKMDASGQIISDKVLPAARDLDREMDDLKRNWKGVWSSMQEAAVPAAIDIVKGLQDIIEQARQVPNLPFFKWIMDQSKMAKDAVKADNDEMLRLLRSRGAFGAQDPKQERREWQWEEPQAKPVSDAEKARQADAQRNADKLAAAAIERAKQIEEAQKAAAAAAKQHAKEVDELATVMNISTDEAEKNLAVLKEFDRLQKAAAIDAKLKEAHFGPEEGPAFQLPTEEEMRRLEEMTAGITAAQEEYKSLLSEFERTPTAMEAMLQSWDLTLSTILDGVTIIDDAIGAILSNLTRAFEESIHGLFTGYQTGAAIILRLITAIGDALVAVLARVAAALLTLGIVRLIGALTGIPTMGLENLLGLSSLSSGGAGSKSLSSGGDRRSVVNNNREFGFTVQIDAVDAKSVADMFQSPAGAIRLQRFAQMATVPI